MGGAKGLQRDNAAGADIGAVEEDLERVEDSCVRGLGEEAEEPMVAFEERPRRALGTEKVQWR
jgi:hypothetical protein